LCASSLSLSWCLSACFCERMHACMYTWFTTGRAAQHSETTTACSHSGAAECGDPAKVASSLLIVAAAVRAQTIARSQNNSHTSPALINSLNNSCSPREDKHESQSDILSQGAKWQVNFTTNALAAHPRARIRLLECVHGPWYASTHKQKGLFTFTPQISLELFRKHCGRTMSYAWPKLLLSIKLISAAEYILLWIYPGFHIIRKSIRGFFGKNGNYLKSSILCLGDEMGIK